MVDTKRITLYASVDSPYPHRVRLALEEAKVAYDIIWIDLLNKPDWYEKKVNPAGGKVPYLVYDGPKLGPDEAPSAESFRTGESLVILEFLNDIFPNARLLPADPTLRAHARLFYLTMEAEFVPVFKAFVFGTATAEKFLSVLEQLQTLLPPTGFVAGEWSIADAAFAPFLVRLMLLLKDNLGLFGDGVGAATLKILRSARFVRLGRYFEDNMARPSMVKTWEEAKAREKFVQHHARIGKVGNN
ncbi:thioredoxin-like protein [Trametes meyenii]|nr:thioredoxin-like protein [Trametes meyenii]